MNSKQMECEVECKNSKLEQDDLVLDLIIVHIVDDNISNEKFVHIDVIFEITYF